MQRTHTCGALRLADLGRRVRVCGWVQRPRVIGGAMFVPLRDRFGTTQLLVPAEATATCAAGLPLLGGLPAATSARDLLKQLPVESVVCAEGVVRERPAGSANSRMPTGEVEIETSSVHVLNTASRELPFTTSAGDGVKDEQLRLRYRYLDLRRDQLQRNLVARSAIVSGLRESLLADSFLEVETPTLFKSTPEGAREFLVPARPLADGEPRCYALVQSPQQYKQMLMAGGIDRYFQLARCYRDEGGRSDRQPEFSQLDLEMSFVDATVVMATVEAAVKHAWNAGADPSLQLDTGTHFLHHYFYPPNCSCCSGGSQQSLSN